MGLAASQGRLLMLTARQNDLELQAQHISHQRLVLNAKMDEISQAYEDAVNNRQMRISMQSSDGTAVNMNLTYANLVSSAANLGANDSGLNKVEGVNTSEYSGTKSFRLVCGDAIVVSDISEIPGEKTTTYPATQYATDTTTNIGFYNKTETEVNNTTGITTTTTTKYFALEKIKDSDLEKAANSDTLAKGCILKTDGTNYYIKYGDDYYTTAGAKVELDETVIDNLHTYCYDNGTTNSEEEVQFVHDTASVPKSTLMTYSAVTEDKVVNNRITVNGKAYIIDKQLAKSDSGINYLQECIRNGKYSIETYQETSEKVLDDSWTKISWSAAPSISDRYYEEDDAAAKAEYDRLIAQVHAQDKKLELDLDAIETQRNAVKTEIDSVEKVINDNVEKTFNAFG